MTAGALDQVAALVQALGIALAITVLTETAIAVLFGIRGRGLLAVALINVITNLPLNLVVAALSMIGFFAAGHKPVGFWTAVIVLEAFVVLVEWRLLCWSLAAADRSRQMLVLSASMNAASMLTCLGLQF